MIVNRVWQHVFGRGLVETPDDFGRMGGKPSHPELLDDLAARFVRDGWSIKALIRELMLSRTYQLSSRGEGDNTLLWRANKKRLDAEWFFDVIYRTGFCGKFICI